jgi:hypothetical protein
MATRSANTTIAELQAQLIAAITARDEAIGAKDQAYLAMRAAESGACAFLKKLPIEIRNEVYKLLLVNDALSTTSVLSFWRKYNHHERLEQFGLHPTILRTCRQIYDEASNVLYAANTFIIDLTDYNWVRSPITRKWRTVGPNNMLDFAPIRKVRRWRVILTADQKECHWPQSPAFVMFCRELYQQPLKSLEVLIQPMENPSSTYQYSFNRTSHFKMEEILQPLALFRNVTRLELRTLKGMYLTEDMPELLDVDEIPHHIAPKLKSDLMSSAQGVSPVVLVFKMYEKLASYARSFERCERFRKEMSVSYSDLVHGISYPRKDNDRRPEELLNPFTHHPIEGMLQTANRQSIDHEPDAFMKTRKDLLQYLEPQYQRIAGAAAKMADFVKSWKRSSHLLDPLLDLPNWRWEGFAVEDFGIAALRVEEYATAFRRDAPLHIQGKIRAVQRQFDLAYKNSPRDRLLEELSDWLEVVQGEGNETMKNSTRMSQFTKCFQAAVDDMDTQYLSIRKMRKALFEFDPAGINENHDIDLELWRCDEMINWDVREPEMDVANYVPQSRRA